MYVSAALQDAVAAQKSIEAAGLDATTEVIAATGQPFDGRRGAPPVTGQSLPGDDDEDELAAELAEMTGGAEDADGPPPPVPTVGPPPPAPARPVASGKSLEELEGDVKRIQALVMEFAMSGQAVSALSAGAGDP